MPPPGRYIVEVVLADPWNRPVRPNVRTANSTSVTLGQPDEIEHYRSTRRSEDPLHVLEVAISSGRVLRSLSSSEVVGIAPHALEAACCLLDTLGARALNARPFHYMTRLFGSSAQMLASSACGAIDRGRVSSADLLRLAIAVIPLTAARVDAEVDLADWPTTAAADAPDMTDSMLRDLWSTCPPIAALLDVPCASRGNEESLERCEAFLGIRPGQEVEHGEAVSIHEWHLSPEVLRDIHRAMELKPVRLLDLDALVEANFEWLLAEREGRLNSTAWCAQHTEAHHHLPLSNADVHKHISARRPKPLLEEGMKLSRRVLGAAIHVASSGPMIEHAVQALLPLVDCVPKLLTRDLTLAVLLVNAQGSNTPSATPEPYAEPA